MWLLQEEAGVGWGGGGRAWCTFPELHYGLEKELIPVPGHGHSQQDLLLVRDKGTQGWTPLYHILQLGESMELSSTGVCCHTHP